MSLLTSAATISGFACISHAFVPGVNSCANHRSSQSDNRGHRGRRALPMVVFRPNLPTMMRPMVIFLVALASFASFDVRVMFGWYSTQQVPIGRLFTNLQERLARNTNDFEVTYDLARLHSMAYSTSLFSIGVRTNDSRPEFYSPG